MKRFKLIGQSSSYTPTRKGEAKIDLAPVDRFMVEAGDVIGAYHPSDASVALLYHDGYTMAQFARFLRNHGTSVIGRKVTTNSTNNCRRYQTEVSIASDSYR